MKYTVEGFSQRRLVTLELTVGDAVLLRWFVDWIASGTMQSTEHDGSVYYWVRHKKVVEELPVLGITNTKVMGRHLHRLVEAGVLISHIPHSKNGNLGRYTFYRTGPAYVGLIDTGHSAVPEQGTDEYQSRAPKSTNKDSSINNSSIKDSREGEPPSPPPMKDPLCRKIDERFRADQEYENFGRERGQIKILAQRCRRRNSEHPEEVADAMVEGFAYLRKNGREWWSRQPFTPSRLSGQWEAVEAEMIVEAGEIEQARELHEKEERVRAAGF